MSAEEDENIMNLKNRIVGTLELIKIYLKPQGEEADMEEPLIMRKGVDIGDVCDKLHRSFRRIFDMPEFGVSLQNMKDKKVSINHILADEDILQIIKEF